MEKNIYKSNNEDSLIKSFGPYIYITADNSKQRIDVYESTEIKSEITIGKIKSFEQFEIFV
ncbi:MAG: hypothetical protein ACFFCE_05680 [Promethearchaeota archaeon]